MTAALCRYVRHYGLGGACDDVASVLRRVAARLGKAQKVKVLTGTGEVRGLVSPGQRAAWPSGGGQCGKGEGLEGEGLSPILRAAGLSGAGCTFPHLPPAASKSPGTGVPQIPVDEDGGGPALHGGVLPYQTLPSSPGDVNVIQPNYTAAARDFLRTFRSGLLGPVMLDRDTLHTPPAEP